MKKGKKEEQPKSKPEKQDGLKKEKLDKKEKLMEMLKMTHCQQMFLVAQKILIEITCLSRIPWESMLNKGTEER